MKAAFDILLEFGLPAVLAGVMLWFMVMHIRHENKRPSDEGCPLWARAGKQQIIDWFDNRIEKLESEIRTELKEHGENSGRRDRRQQRIENLLTEIRTMLAGRQG